MCSIEVFRTDTRKGGAKGSEGYERGKQRPQMVNGETLDGKERRAHESLLKLSKANLGKIVRGVCLLHLLSVEQVLSEGEKRVKMERSKYRKCCSVKLGVPSR